jgi:Bacterial RNA polymerase, alpha chain C terminal domain
MGLPAPRSGAFLSQKKGNPFVKVTIRFGNPFLVLTYTVSMLAIGWAIGSHWGSTLAAGWMLLFAAVCIVIHDSVVFCLLVIAATRVATSGKNQKPGRRRRMAESPECRRAEPHASSVDSQVFSAIRDRLGYQQVRQKLDLNIEELEFSVRTYGFLKDADIHTVRALVQFTEEDLIHAGFTSTMIDEISYTLGVIGLHSGMHFED